MTKVPKGSKAVEATLRAMTSTDVQMRVGGITRILEAEKKPLTAKEIGYRLKKTEGWAGVYLQIGERQGIFYRTRITTPVKWGLVADIPKTVHGPLLPPAAVPVAVQISALPVDVIRTLRVLEVYHKCSGLEETVAFCIRSYSAHVVIKDRVSLVAIEEELNRHDAMMERLRKGV